jgi:hypothetical protein
MADVDFVFLISFSNAAHKPTPSGELVHGAIEEVLAGLGLPTWK